MFLVFVFWFVLFVLFLFVWLFIVWCLFDLVVIVSLGLFRVLICFECVWYSVLGFGWVFNLVACFVVLCLFVFVEFDFYCVLGCRLIRFGISLTWCV